MKRISHTIARFFSVAFVLLFSLFSSGQSARANTVDDVITSINVYNQKGEELTDGLSPWEKFQIDANFAFNYGKVQPGDTTTIGLPVEFALEGADFEVKDDDGNLVATAVVDASSKQLTLTYTDYVLTRSHIEGKVHLLARVDHNVVRDKGSIPLKLIVGKKIIEYGKIDYKGLPGQATPYTFIKYGWNNADNIKSITYSLNINQQNQELDNVVISDTLGFNTGEIDINSFQILKGSWVVDPADNSYRLSQQREDVTGNYTINFAADKRSFTINMGHIGANEGFYVRYRVNFPTIPADGTVFPNDAILRADNIEEQKSSVAVRYQRANGYAHGDIYGVQVTKKDEAGKPLAGAEFTLYDEDGVTVVQKATSDANGIASFSNLIKEHYVIKETKAPAGYQLSDEEIQVNAAQLKNYGSGIIYKDFTNRQALITASGTKTWNDDNDKDGKRPDKITVRLHANGVEVASKEVGPNAQGEWKYEFTDLPATGADGKDIVYSVTEDRVYGYTAIVDGMNITNTPVPGVPRPPKPSSDNSSKSSSSSTTSSSSSSTGSTDVIIESDNGSGGGNAYNVVTKKGLPKTGENASWIMIAAGVALVGLVGFIVFRAKKK